MKRTRILLAGSAVIGVVAASAVAKFWTGTDTTGISVASFWTGAGLVALGLAVAQGSQIGTWYSPGNRDDGSSRYAVRQDETYAATGRTDGLAIAAPGLLLLLVAFALGRLA